MRNHMQYSGEGEILTCGDLKFEVIPDLDYYKGVPTMLTCEEAALCMAEKIYNSLPEDGEFFDSDFGPIRDGDLEGSSKALYFGA